MSQQEDLMVLISTNLIEFQEDILLRSLVRRYGQKKWAKMSEQINRLSNGKEKSGKQCRQRWYNHLDISITKKQWSHQEEDLLFLLHERYGNKWTTIAEQMNGRSDNSIKNHFYSVLRKSLRRINKYLGMKDSTAKIQKIKSSTLTKIFQFKQQVQEEKIEQRDRQPQYITEQKNCRQYAYLLIKFSRSKLLNKKTNLNRKDKEIFQKILQTVIKINEYKQKQQKTLNQAKKEEEKSENSENSSSFDSKLLKNKLRLCQKQKSFDIDRNPNNLNHEYDQLLHQKAVIYKAKDEIFSQIMYDENQKHPETDLLQQKPTPNNPNCQSDPTHKDNLNFGNDPQNEYSFCISLNEHDVPQIEDQKFQLFMPVTPYLLSPRQEQGLYNIDIPNKKKEDTIVDGGEKICQWEQVGDRQIPNYMNYQQNMQ